MENTVILTPDDFSEDGKKRHENLSFEQSLDTLEWTDFNLSIEQYVKAQVVLFYYPLNDVMKVLKSRWPIKEWEIKDYI